MKPFGKRGEEDTVHPPPGKGGPVLLSVLLLFLAVSHNAGRDVSHVFSASAAPFIIVPAAALLGYHVVTNQLVSHNDQRAPRDPETGVLIGAEPYDAGPRDASCAVLCIHGFLGAANNFNELPSRIAETGRFVRVMRLPGHGTSPRDLERVTADSLVQAARDEVQALGKKHDRVVLIGHSMGGTIASLVAAESGCDGLVLAAPYFGVTRRWWYVLKPETWNRIMHPVVRWLYKSDAFVQVNRRGVVDEIVSYRWVPMQGVRTLMELGRRANDRETLANITCPVLLLYAEGDDAAS
ncbi:MAG: alpha/beta fold hydrolase, partial [Candidatus Latescibacteria bacterium]|nr:alpha/beta fold hydrolase [Candidatus Latescibacterota bacterium]